jgi:hypothetical protein
MRFWILSALLVPFAVTLLWLQGSSRPATAGTAVELDVAGLTDHAGLIVEGRVLAAIPLEENGLVFTEYRLSATRTHFGEARPEQVFRWPGGVLADGSGLLLPGLPRLSAGEEVLLFLTEENARGLRTPVGLGQGSFLVARPSSGGRLLVRSHGDLALLDARGALRSAPRTSVFDYAAVVSEIEAAVAARRARGGKGADLRGSDR